MAKATTKIAEDEMRNIDLKAQDIVLLKGSDRGFYAQVISVSECIESANVRLLGTGKEEAVSLQFITKVEADKNDCYELYPFLIFWLSNGNRIRVEPYNIEDFWSQYIDHDLSAIELYGESGARDFYHKSGIVRVSLAPPVLIEN